MFDYLCEVCGAERRAWRPADAPPRFCSAECRNVGMVGRSSKRTKWLISPEIHEAIRRLYQERLTGNGQVKTLAQKLGLPRWKVGRYAIRQGWTPKQKKEPDWSEREVGLLEKWARYSPEEISRRLGRRGYRRSVVGIVLKLKRSRCRASLEGYSARSVANCLGVDDHFVVRAIRAGRLRATRRGTARTEAQGGDHWWIKEKAIRDYLIENIHEVDLRRVDKYWLVDLLVNGNGKQAA
jgi:hypothetical protein